MRTILILAWLLIPIAGFFYHGGPGQAHLTIDDVARHLAAAETHSVTGDWEAVEAEYAAALQLLPPERTDESQRIRLERAKAQLLIQQLPQAHQGLKMLVEELHNASDADPALLAEARGALANSQYYLTWLMRLEGLPKDAWEPEIESARQTYRLLAEQSVASGDAEASERNKEDLESVIRLARMDLSDLQGLSLPSQCQGCCSGKKPSSSKEKGQKKPDDARGASSGPPPDDGGS